MMALGWLCDRLTIWFRSPASSKQSNIPPYLPWCTRIQCWGEWCKERADKMWRLHQNACKVCFAKSDSRACPLLLFKSLLFLLLLHLWIHIKIVSRYFVDLKVEFDSVMVYRIDLAGLSPKSTIHDLTRRFAPCLSLKLAHWSPEVRLRVSYARKANFIKCIKKVKKNKVGLTILKQSPIPSKK